MSLGKLGIPFLSLFLAFGATACMNHNPVAKEELKQDNTAKPPEKPEIKESIQPEQAQKLSTEAPVTPDKPAEVPITNPTPVTAVSSPVFSSGSGNSSSGGGGGSSNTTSGSVSVNVDLSKPSQQENGTVSVTINPEHPVSAK